jgi:hypothetical protein
MALKFILPAIVSAALAFTAGYRIGHAGGEKIGRLDAQFDCLQANPK